MRRRVCGTAAVLGLLGVLAALAPAASARAATGGRAAPASLEQIFDNRAVSDDTRPAEADFDGSGGSLSAQDLTAAGWTPGRSLTVQGARLTWPRRTAGEPDNVRAAGQSVRVRGRGDALALLVAGTGGTDATGTGTVHYSGGTRSSYRLTAPDWRTGPLAAKAVALPHINTPGGQLAEKARLYVVTVPIVRGRAVTSVTLPRNRDLHVFALSVRPESRGWTGSWAASSSGRTAVGPWTDRTLRLVVHASAGGPRVRIRLDNTFASAPVRVASATVALQAEGAAARSAPVPLSFRGAAGTEIPAGAQAFSDPLGFEVPADANLLVSFHLPGTVTAAPVHRLAQQTSYVSEPGDHAGDGSAAAYTSTITTWPLLTGVDVGGGPGSVVLLGDSITDGEKSTVGANRRWPDLLARRLAQQNAVPRYGVLNQGISANRVLTDRYPGDGVSTDTGGVSALHRLDRDVLAQTSARTAVVFQGVNDVRWGATAAEVIAGLREIAARGHERGLRMLVATIAPCAGEARCTPAVDAQRVTVNEWIRGNQEFDGVLDFDAVLRDPEQPTRMLAAYDSGDHLHPGDAGLAALAASVDLRALVP
ncbi:SGNH/GDSL hydrolase family protein [Streptomyces ipomoeae]|uniref:GDSL-like protein n=2 Tax=Streptomyces ipomoeae TaxID=103232 RepID=L1L8M6_9ACTN|nr:SGNH/GDSL hydrolase family protein [Streptomyces ipomoeae]EKX69376.1 GDSL-like protein [Streptomyces ipomoeae 91-03]MDX2697478.1 SGNH/GDSL hydrolase family protein [Streptomyces ipomoeae]MDX2843235.1 SGNH/GDSL hydrolase family protein [Streptomyces ipomoeae]TQE31938.1 SGNH/GDSL hydrolase family protein [Streptomyces ipomoeae]